MPQHERTDHRRAIAGVVEVVLAGYWQPSEAEELRAAILRDWCDELENFDARSIRAALRQWRQENPSKRPNPGHILAILNAAWGRKNAEQVRAALAAPFDRPKDRISDDRRRAILAEVGIRDPLAAKTIDSIEATE